MKRGWMEWTATDRVSSANKVLDTDLKACRVFGFFFRLLWSGHDVWTTDERVIRSQSDGGDGVTGSRDTGEGMWVREVDLRGGAVLIVRSGF